MAKMVDISVLGDKKLMRQLRRLAGPAQKKVVRKALREGGRPVLASTQAKVPVKTGALKNSLKLRAIKYKSRDRFGVAVRTGTREQLGIDADDPYYYPMAVEVGTAKAPAHSYLRAGMDETREQAKGIITREIASGIIREARKG